jgi:hypothetical protein
LPLYAGQLGRIVTTGGVGNERLNPIFHIGDIITGKEHVLTYNAIRASHRLQFQITGACRFGEGRYAIDSANFYVKLNWVLEAENKVHWKPEDVICRL